MSACQCSYGYEDSDDGYAEFARVRRVARTRKDHQCLECGAVIPSGSHCCNAFWVGGGEVCNAYRCPTCAALAELVAEINKACPLWGGLRDSCDYTDGVDWYEWHQKAKSLSAS